MSNLKKTSNQQHVEDVEMVDRSGEPAPASQFIFGNLNATTAARMKPAATKRSLVIILRVSKKLLALAAARMEPAATKRSLVIRIRVPKRLLAAMAADELDVTMPKQVGKHRHGSLKRQRGPENEASNAMKAAKQVKLGGEDQGYV
ncbi:MAG: hypothetical protein Q9170_002414 [Blastenia crenularia]